MTVDELLDTMSRVRPLLYRARQQRIPPALDDKIITSWNGMMISAMAEAGRVLGVDRYVGGARRAADFLLRVHRTRDGTLLRTSRHGRAHLNAVLEDYAYLAEGSEDVRGGMEPLRAAMPWRRLHWRGWHITSTARNFVRLPLRPSVRMDGK